GPRVTPRPSFFAASVGPGHTGASLGRQEIRMLYAILCYNTENTVFSWSKEQEQKVMDDLRAVQDKHLKAKKLGPVARLMPTTAATTLRKGEPPLVLDGPFAETREQLLGFYVFDAEN